MSTNGVGIVEPIFFRRARSWRSRWRKHSGAMRWSNSWNNRWSKNQKELMSLTGKNYHCMVMQWCLKKRGGLKYDFQVPMLLKYLLEMTDRDWNCRPNVGMHYSPLWIDWRMFISRTDGWDRKSSCVDPDIQSWPLWNLGGRLLGESSADSYDMLWYTVVLLLSCPRVQVISYFQKVAKVQSGKNPTKTQPANHKTNDDRNTFGNDGLQPSEARSTGMLLVCSVKVSSNQSMWMYHHSQSGLIRDNFVILFFGVGESMNDYGLHTGNALQNVKWNQAWVRSSSKRLRRT